MNEKEKVFRKLLPIKKLFWLYQNISTTIITKIDVINIGFDAVAVDNSVRLLCEIEMIKYDYHDNTFQKVNLEETGFDDFFEALYMNMRLSYKKTFLFINQVDLKYDEAEAKLYIKRNSVSLNLSGLLMLLEGLGKIQIKHNNIFILDKSLLSSRADEKMHAKQSKTLEELKKQLEINEKFGAEAEVAAMEYETDLLKKAGIDKCPERISEFNTSAGYDIVSFKEKSSVIPDKFIEVKSCFDDSWIFYISKNELEVAKFKQNNYYLYLYNRKSRGFRVIQNPYNFFMKDEIANQWIIEPQVYRFKSLERISRL